MNSSHQLSLFGSRIPFKELDHLVISSPQISHIPYQVRTRYMQLYNSPRLRHIEDLNVSESAKFGNVPRFFRTLGLQANNSILTPGISKATQEQLIAHSNTHKSVETTMQSAVDFHKTFRIDGFASNLPSAINLETQTYKFPLEYVTGPDEEDILKTSRNSLSEFKRLKGDLFEYICFLTLSLLHPEQRLYREFCPLISQADGTYNQGFRVDAFINNQAYECKWFFLKAQKIHENQQALATNGIELQGLISKYNSFTINVPFQPIEELAEPLTKSTYPGVKHTINRCLKLIADIHTQEHLPPNAEILANALYNIVDQSALKPAGEKQEFITEHVNGVLARNNFESLIKSYVTKHNLHFPPMDDECTFRYQDHMYQSFTQPRSECGDPHSLVRSFEFWSGLVLPSLEVDFVLSDLEHGSSVSDYFVSDANLPALVMAQAQTDPYLLNQLYSRIKSHQASLLDVYTLLESIPTITHRLFSRNNPIYIAT